MEGFEPSHGGIKIRCLTTWLHPNDAVRKIRRGARTIVTDARPFNGKLGPQSAANFLISPMKLQAKHWSSWIYRQRLRIEIAAAIKPARLGGRFFCGLPKL